jgi:putative CRISPR-associated protein (TIGR02619 family)
MKKIITTVGTSLATNDERVKNLVEDIRQETFDITLFDSNGQESSIKREIKELERKLYEYILNHPAKASAELSSLDKIDPEGTSEIYLLCTETNLSYLCGRVLCEYLTKEKNQKVDVILVNGLQVKDKKRFETEGLVELLDQMEKISAGDWQSVIINMTGGYKAIIPFLTIVAQINQIPTYYIFDDSQKGEYPLIKMPQTPIDVNWSEFEKYNHVWEELREGIDNWSQFKAQHQIDDDFHSCVWFDDNNPEYALLSGIGEAFYKRYKQWTFVHVLQNGPFASIENRRRALNEAISNLQGKLNDFIKSNGLQNATKEEVIHQIRSNGGELDHTNIMRGTDCLISKYPSANPEIRILYSFDLNNGKISPLKIWNFRIGSFNHSTYPKEFRDFFNTNQHSEQWIPYLQTRNF